MTTAPVSQMKCACPACVCIVDIEQAVKQNDQCFCSQVCADGHPNGHGDCGHAGCDC